MLERVFQRRSRFTVISAVFVIAVIACEGAESYTLVADCMQGDTLDGGCPVGSGSPYTCNNGSLPSDSDPTLVCGKGYPRPNGATVFCCASDTVPPTCSEDSTVPCESDEIGYSCGGDIPSQSDPALECVVTGGSNTNGATSTQYCCSLDAGSSACTQIDADSGLCSGGALGFVCTSGASPQTDDSSLKCSAPMETSDGNVSYCCTH